MAIIIETVLRWRPSRHLPDRYLIQVVLDDADFDLEAGTGERLRRVLRYRVLSNNLRDAGFNIFVTGRPVERHRVLSDAGVLLVNMVGRVTEGQVRTTFTPDPVDPQPGSVAIPTLLTSGSGATTEISATSAEFTPAANSLLMVGEGARGSTQTVHSYTNTHAGQGTWNSLQQVGISGANRISMGYSQTGPAPGAGTLTVFYNLINRTRWGYIIFQTTGHNTLSPLADSNTSLSDISTMAASMAQLVPAGNMCMGVASSQDATDITAGANETELAEVGSGGTSPVRVQVEYGEDFLVNWTTLGEVSNQCVAMEIQAAEAFVHRATMVIG